MRLLLDSQVLLWWAAGDAQLGTAARESMTLLTADDAVRRYDVVTFPAS